MRRLPFKIIALFLFSILSLSSCDSSDDDIEPQKGQISAKIDGELWIADLSQATLVQGILNIVGTTQSTGRIVTITWAEKTTVGTVNLANEDMIAGAYVAKSGEIAYTSNAQTPANGTITISKLDLTDSLTSGTFEFEAYRPIDSMTVSITEGVFTDLPIINGSSGTGNSSFSAKIDGNSFSAANITGTVVSFFGRTTLNLSASDADNKSIGFQLPADIDNGTYDLVGLGVGLGDEYIATYSEGLNATILVTEAGKLTITNHIEGELIEGTFFFNLSDLAGGTDEERDITEGEFSINY